MTTTPAAVTFGPVDRSSSGFRVEVRSPRWSGWLEVRGDGVTPKVSGEALAALGLPVAMSVGVPLEVPLPVSDRVWRRLPRLQQMLAEWNPGWSAVPVRFAGHAPRLTAPARGKASFFSGGVDSFFTALDERRALDALIFVHGFERVLDDPGRAALVEPRVDRAAEELGIPLVKVTTNLRDLLDGAGLRWGRHSHGFALASVALTLSAELGQVLVPASFPYRDLFPWGSHPLLEPSWSTEALEISMHGCGAGRTRKTAAVGRAPAAQRHLRVCWQTRGEVYNCGRCGKCLRTACALEAAGVLDECETLPSPLDLDAVRSMRTERASSTVSHADLVRELRPLGPSPLLGALEESWYALGLGDAESFFPARELPEIV